MKLKISTLLTASTLAISFCQSVHATPFSFEDNFNRVSGKTVGNGWSEIEYGDRGNVKLQNLDNHESTSNQALSLIGNSDNTSASHPDAAATHFFNLSNIELLSLSFNWISNGKTEKQDFLNLSWATSNGSGAEWTPLWKENLGGKNSENDLSKDKTKVTLNNLNSLFNQSSVYLRFWTSVNSSNEGAYIDNFKLTGNTRNQSSGQSGVNALAISNVPEPSAIALLGLGVMGWLGFKRKSV
ncbi:MAG: PEP-CTERM sorting domain-containing protein [Methylococcales bacterium]